MASSRITDVHFHVVRYLPNRIDGNRADSGQVQHRARPQIETRAVSPAFDDTVDHVALGQRHSLMSAFIVHSEHLTAGAHEANGDPLDDYTEGRVLGKVASQESTRPSQRSCRMTLAKLAEWWRHDEVEVSLTKAESAPPAPLGPYTRHRAAVRSPDRWPAIADPGPMRPPY